MTNVAARRPEEHLSSTRRPPALIPRALWVVGFASVATLAFYLVWLSLHPQMDFQVYRMGGEHVFRSDLYSSEISVRGWRLLFTYPPFAAFLFWPLSHVSTFIAQLTWDAINLAALTALIAVSIAAAQARRPVRTDWRTSLLLLAPAGLLLYPVRTDLAFGQINIVLTLMIVADLTMGVRCRGRSLPRGVLVGLAAAIKLTPLVFIAYLVVSRQWRTARNATLGFGLATGAMFLLNPRASSVYFTKDVLDVGRIGNSKLLGNQSLHAALARADPLLSSVRFELVGAALLCVGVTLATVAFRRSSTLLSVLICAATGLLLSPVSWTHHYVWIIPVLIWLLAGVDRPAGGEWWALGAALAFIVMLPFGSSGSGVLWYVRANAYVVAIVLFIALISIMLSLRRQTRMIELPGQEYVPDVLPSVTIRSDQPRESGAGLVSRRRWQRDQRF